MPSFSYFRWLQSTAALLLFELFDELKFDVHIDYIYNRLITYVGIFYKLAHKYLTFVVEIFTMRLLIPIKLIE